MLCLGVDERRRENLGLVEFDELPDLYGSRSSSSAADLCYASNLESMLTILIFLILRAGLLGRGPLRNGCPGNRGEPILIFRRILLSVYGHITEGCFRVFS